MSNTLTRCEGVCDKTPDAGSGIGDSLSVIQMNLSRLVRPDPPVHATTPWLFYGCLIPSSTVQGAAQGAQCVPQPYHQIQRGSLRFQGTAASTFRASLR